MHKKEQMDYWVNRVFVLMVLVVFCTAEKTYWQECGIELDAKAQKLLDKSQDKKKYKSAQRTQFLKDALELDENCLECMFQLGKKAYRRAKNETYDFGLAKDYLTPLVSLCPEYHSDPYYYLGAMAYADQEILAGARIFR